MALISRKALKYALGHTGLELISGPKAENKRYGARSGLATKSEECFYQIQASTVIPFGLAGLNWTDWWQQNTACEKKGVKNKINQGRKRTNKFTRLSTMTSVFII